MASQAYTGCQAASVHLRARTPDKNSSSASFTFAARVPQGTEMQRWLADLALFES